jgi:two-component sensor histidine kinase
MRRLIEQRDILVREVHHRIKNNLAAITVLLQKHITDHPEFADIVRHIEPQLYAIADMHGLESVSSGGIFLRHLLQTVSHTTESLFGATVKLKLSGSSMQALRLREEESVPLALVLNELLTNACKHGTREPLEVNAAADGKSVVIEVVNGVARGIAPLDFERAERGQGGLSLVRALLPHKKASLRFNSSRTRVFAIVRLAPDVFAAGGSRPEG